MGETPAASRPRQPSIDRPTSTTPLFPAKARKQPEAVDMARRTNLKMDLGLLPLLSLLYLFNGLDRGNIGNAQTQGNDGCALTRYLCMRC